MNEFKLPGSSYGELVKMIRAYGNKKVGVPCSLDDVAKSSALDKSQISRNNGFFTCVGLVTGGKAKSPSEICNRLATAYSLKMDEKVSSCWRELITKNDFLMDMINVISIKISMNKIDFVNHIVFSSGVTNTNNTRAGAVALIDIFKISKLLIEDGGKVFVSNIEMSNEISNGSASKKEIESIKEENNNIPKTITGSFVQEYTCEHGEKAQIILPNNIGVDDLLTLYDMFKTLLKRKYKISEDEL